MVKAMKGEVCSLHKDRVHKAKAAARDKQRLDSDRGSQGDSMDDSRSPTGMLRTNAFCQISLKILHANPPLAKSKD